MSVATSTDLVARIGFDELPKLPKSDLRFSQVESLRDLDFMFRPFALERLAALLQRLQAGLHHLRDRALLLVARGAQRVVDFVLAKELTDGTCRALGVTPDTVQIILTDIKKENWAEAGKLFSD